MLKCLGVLRETTNSPNHEQDDELILRAVGEELQKLGAQVRIIEPRLLSEIDPSDWDVVIPMCENYPAMRMIQSWSGPMVINTMDAVLNCYRVNMTPLMEVCPGIHPRTEIRNLRGLPGAKPAFCGEHGVWLKRGDVHNTCDHDVVYVGKWEDCAAVKEDFESREITSVVIQEHIEGDLIKFYGVGPMKWFDWFYHKGDKAAKYPFSVKQLEQYAAKVADAVGLEVYGGDAIVTPAGRIYVIDINSWPSFARVRNTVKTHIAKHVFDRAAKKAAIKEKVK